MHTSRRKFIEKAGLGLAIASSPLLFSFKNKKHMKDIFIHHVFFWLNKPNSTEDKAALVAGLKKLSNITTIKKYHIGKAASTSRDVIDGSYAISWYVQFENATDQDSYQTDPTHLKFVEECKHLWSKVVVYDSIDV